MVQMTRSSVVSERLPCFEANKVRSLEATLGEAIYGLDREPSEVYVILAGHVSISQLTPAGRRLITSVLSPGDMFGQFSSGAIPDGEEAQARTDARLLVMDSGYAEHLAECDSGWGLRLVEAAAARVSGATERLVHFSSMSVEARVANAVLEYAFDDGTAARVTHQEIGDFAGTYRETATRVLNDLKSRGFLTLGRGEVQILDRGELVAVARGASPATQS